MLEHLGDEDWHYSDEENLFDWKARAERVRNQLESAEGETILVVSHGHFLKVLTGHLLFGDLYSPDIYLRTYHNMTMSNTGISEFVLDSEQGWRLITWNDRAHLT
jgi:broad specificity phosphatase PhoE